MRREVLPNDFIKRNSFGARQFDGFIQWVRYSNPGQNSGDIVGEDRLK
jgi:hypothetical protein